MRCARNLRNRGNQRSLWALALAVGSMVGVAAVAEANSVNVQLSRTTSTADPVVTENTPITIPDAPGQTYDAADTADSGTIWNSLIAPTVNHLASGTRTDVVEQNLSLVDSSGAASPISISTIQFTENSGKNDTIHQTGIVNGTNPGTDGLSSNPTGLMNQSWFDNGTSEMITFNLTGLNAGAAYNLYVYGAGSNVGFGGTYTVPVANQTAAYTTALTASSFAFTTEPNNGSTAQIFRSVFDASGINPAPEQNLSWVLLPVMADGSGNLSFTVNKDASSGIKGSINGFQLDSVPEPTSLGLLALGGVTMLGRKRSKQ